MGGQMDKRRPKLLLAPCSHNVPKNNNPTIYSSIIDLPPSKPRSKNFQKKIAPVTLSETVSRKA
jgi:hypothetical protein